MSRKKIFSKFNRDIICVDLLPDGKIIKIENNGVRFPFSVGQVLNRSSETFANVNGYDLRECIAGRPDRIIIDQAQKKRRGFEL